MLRDGVIVLFVVSLVCAVVFVGGAAGVVRLDQFHVFSVALVAIAAVSSPRLARTLTRNSTPPEFELMVPPPETSLGTALSSLPHLLCHVGMREDTPRGSDKPAKECPPPPGRKYACRTSTQVYLGPEITVEVTGQRALAILSRGSLVLNTSITAEPSTLGGFPGGGGVARDPGVGGGGGGSLLLSPPSLPPAFGLSSLVDGTLEGLGDGGSDVPSYNINGPGSANYRYYMFTITTSADDVDEVQRVSTQWWILPERVQWYS